MHKFYCAILLFVSSLIFGQKAVFIKPVVDLFPRRLSLYGPDFKNSYKNSQLCWYDQAICIRTAQGLYNKVVDLLEYDKKTGEVRVELADALYASGGKLKKCAFWTLAENIAVLDDNVDKKFLPAHVTHEKFDSFYDINTLTLIKPWNGYSLGTRFIRDPKSDTKSTHGIWVLGKDLKFECVQVDRSSVLLGSKKLSNNDRRRLFVRLAREIARPINGIVPYVWGGASYTGPVSDKGFYVVKDLCFDKKTLYWKRKNLQQPYAGFDCSGLVLLLAHTCGIPYFYKTTSTAFDYSQQIDSFKNIKEGDLIVRKGHVLIISDLANNQVIESVGYRAGFGRVHEIELTKRFDVKNFKDFFERCKQHEKITSFKNNGEVAEESDYKIISLWA